MMMWLSERGGLMWAMRRAGVAALAVLLAVTLAGCGGSRLSTVHGLPGLKPTEHPSPTRSVATAADGTKLEVVPASDQDPFVGDKVEIDVTLWPAPQESWAVSRLVFGDGSPASSIACTRPTKWGDIRIRVSHAYMRPGRFPLRVTAVPCGGHLPSGQTLWAGADLVIPSSDAPAAAHLAPCSAGDVRIAFARGLAGMSHAAERYTLTGTDGPCLLTGYPEVTFLDRRGRVIAVREVEGGAGYFWPAVPVHKIEIRRGVVASFDLGLPSDAVYPQPTCPRAAQEVIALPNGGGSVAIPHPNTAPCPQVQATSFVPGADGVHWYYAHTVPIDYYGG